MRKKIAAIAALIMIVAVPIGVMANDSEATGSVTGTYSVYAFDGISWSSDVVYTYDAAQAVMASSMWTNGDSMVAKYTPGTWVTYNYTTYGDITTFMGKTNGVEGKEWNVFVLVNDTLVAATDCLGSYKCFSDYDSNHKTANIFLYYALGTVTSEDVMNSFESYSDAVENSAITSVSGDVYKVTFSLRINYDNVSPTIEETVTDVNGVAISSNNLKTTTVVVEGYGSDCYLALKNAVKSNITGTDVVPGQGYNAYGWMEQMFGLETVQTAGLDTPSDWTDDKYAYWCIYDAPGELADFVLGAYSPLTCAGSDFVRNSFSLIYSEVTVRFLY